MDFTHPQMSEYFSYLRQKKRSEAENRAKIDVAEAALEVDPLLSSLPESESETRRSITSFLKVCFSSIQNLIIAKRRSTFTRTP